MASILMIGNFLSGLGGRISAGEELAVQLRNRGWTTICTSRKCHAVAKLCDMLVTCLARRRSYSVAYVEVYSGRAFLWAEAVCFALRGLRKPYVLALHGGNLPQFSAHRPWRVGRLLSSARAVASPSAYLCRSLAAARRNVNVIPNGIEIIRYSFRARRNPKPRLVWMRALHRIYRPDLAIEVFERLYRDDRSTSLTLIGPDKFDGSRETLDRRASSSSGKSKITYLGPIQKSAVPSELSKYDIFLNTSEIDNTPVSLIEAMACGLCIVTTNVGGVPDLVTHEKEALLVNAGDPESMTNAVRRILREPDLAEHISTQARKKAETFAWGLVLDRWESVFTEIGSV